MNGWLKGWMASESANQDKIEVKRVYIDLNEGNLYDGVMFSQIMYWHGVSRETGKPRMSIERDGFLWLVKGYGDWWEECRIIEPTARASINRIAERGLIVKKLWKFKGAPTLHIRIDWDSLEEQLMWICDDVSNGFDSKYQIGNDMSYQNDLIPDHKSLTDTTADTSSETKSSKSQKPAKGKSDVDQKIDAVITGYVAGLSAKPVANQYGNPNRLHARALVHNGYTPEQVKEYTKVIQGEAYWKGKKPGLLNVANGIAAYFAAKPPVVIPDAPLEIVPKIDGDDTPITEEQRQAGLKMLADLAEAKGRKKEAV